MGKNIFVATLISYLIVGCAGHRPIIDTKGVDMRDYEVDLAECQKYAEQVELGQETAVDAGVGAAFGWALSKVTGGDSKKSASLGAITGGSKGLSDAAQSQKQVITTCLRGRGYKVLN